MENVFHKEFAKNTWYSIREACELGIAYKLWPGENKKKFKDQCTGEVYLLIMEIDENNNLSVRIDGTDPVVKIRTPLQSGPLGLTNSNR